VIIHNIAMAERKPVAWIGASQKNYKAFPDDVQDVMGFALDTAQCGLTPAIAKPFKGLGGGVFELVDDYRTDTYRAVYTVRFAEIVYVLHAFQKKSKKGIATPQKDVELIKKRLRDAQNHHAANFASKK
jgi:phage-related protein